MIALGMPSEYWISICSVRPERGSWRPDGASGMFVRTTSTATAGSARGRLPMAGRQELGFDDSCPSSFGFVLLSLVLEFLIHRHCQVSLSLLHRVRFSAAVAAPGELGTACCQLLLQVLQLLPDNAGFRPIPRSFVLWQLYLQRLDPFLQFADLRYQAFILVAGNAVTRRGLRW